MASGPGNAIADALGIAPAQIMIVIGTLAVLVGLLVLWDYIVAAGGVRRRDRDAADNNTDDWRAIQDGFCPHCYSKPCHCKG